MAFFVLFKTNVVNIFLKIIMKAYSCLVSNGNNRKNSTKFWVGKGRGGFYLKSSEGVAISKLVFLSLLTAAAFLFLAPQ